MSHRLAGPALAAVLLATPALSQGIAPTVIDCDGQASAQFIAEPWEANTRTFSNGEVRVALLDTVEPAAAWGYLMILSSPRDELGFRQCRLIGNDGSGFSHVDFAGLDAQYDPARGLIFLVTVGAYVDGSDTDPKSDLAIILNQASGQIVTQVMD